MQICEYSGDRARLARVLRRVAETSPELACFLMRSAATGARRSEIVALRWSDVEGDLSVPV